MQTYITRNDQNNDRARMMREIQFRGSFKEFQLLLKRIPSYMR